jgi:hypothetical protein
MAREKDHEAGHGLGHMDMDSLSDAISKALDKDKKSDKDENTSLLTDAGKIASGITKIQEGIAIGAVAAPIAAISSFLPQKKKEPTGGFSGSEMDPNKRADSPYRKGGVVPKETKAPPTYSSGSGYHPASRIPSVVANDKAFQDEITRVSQKYNLSEDDLYTVMDYETSGTFDPSMKNKAGSGATGLIQFMPKTARGMGTSTSKLAHMSRADQMHYVDRYLHENHLDRVKNPSLTDAYMTVYKPAAVGKGPDYVHASKYGDKRSRKEYYQNEGFDRMGDRDGKIESWEIAKALNTRGRDLDRASSLDRAKSPTVIVNQNNQTTVNRNSAPTQSSTKPKTPPVRSHFWDGWSKYFSLDHGI